MQQPLSSDIRAKRLPSLTGMRFIATVMVFATHVGLEKFFTNRALDTAVLHQGLDLGWTGVEFFFVLSGFVLTWSASPKNTTTLFWRRRFVKIYPNHLVSWTLALLLALALAVPITAKQFLPSLFLVHTWIPNDTIIKSLNLPSWSLCSEVLFYFLFPWLLQLIRRIREDRLWLYAGVTMAVIALIPVFAAVALPAGHDEPFNMSVVQHWIVYQFPVSRLPDFVLGIIMARIVTAGRWIRLNMLTALALLVVGCVVQGRAALSVWAPTLPVAAPLALLIAAGASADVRDTTSVFRTRPMIWLGEVSFAFFLLHYLVVHYFHVVVGVDRQWATGPALALIAMLGAVSVLAAWALYMFVESPAMRRWSRPKRVPQPGGKTTEDVVPESTVASF